MKGNRTMNCFPTRSSLLSVVFVIAASGQGLVAEGSPEPPSMTVMTYNIHHGEGTDGVLDLERIASIILESKSDVIALQEVDRQTTRTGKVDQARWLADRLGFHCAFGAAMEFDGGQYGNAVLSRWPIGEQRVVALPPQADLRGEPRALLLASIFPDSGTAMIFGSTHLCHISEANRTVQVGRIMTELEGRKNAILGGDFNARSGSPPVEQWLSLGWQNATRGVSRIDYILLPADSPWRVIQARELEQPVASDHNPLVVEMELE